MQGEICSTASSIAKTRQPDVSNESWSQNRFADNTNYQKCYNENGWSQNSTESLAEVNQAIGSERSKVKRSEILVKVSPKMKMNLKLKSPRSKRFKMIKDKDKLRLSWAKLSKNWG